MICLLKKLTEIEVTLSLMFVLVLITMAIPLGGKPIFLPIFLVVAAIFFLRERLVLRFSTGLFILLACIIFYILGVLQNNGILYYVNEKDLINIFLLGLLWPIFSTFTPQRFRRFISIFRPVVILTFTVIALISLYKFYLLSGDREVIRFFLVGKFYPWGSSLVKDYNTFAYTLFPAIILALHALTRTSSIGVRGLYIFSFLIMSLSIVLSGSRRGVAILAFVYLLYLGWGIRNYYLKWKMTKGIGSFNLRQAAFLLIPVIVLMAATANYLRHDKDEAVRIFNRFTTPIDSRSIAIRFQKISYAYELLEHKKVTTLSRGDGFKYINSYAKKFAVPSGEDYPHNPIVSAILYSGILGALGVVALLIYPLYHMYRNKDIEDLPPLILLYIVSLMFIFSSGNSIFSNRFFLFILFLAIFVKKDTAKPTKGELKQIEES